MSDPLQILCPRCGLHPRAHGRPGSPARLVPPVAAVSSTGTR